MNRTTMTIGLAAVLATAGTGAAVAATGGGSASGTASHVVSSVRGSDDPASHDRFDDRTTNLRDRQSEDQAGHHRRHRPAEAGDEGGGRGELEPGDGRGEVEAGDDRGGAVEAGDDRSGRDGSGSDDSGSGGDDSGSGHHDGHDG